MGKKSKPFFILGVFLIVILTAAWYLHSHDIAVLNPQGSIGQKERRLIIEATLLMLIVVIPVYILTFFIAWRYRDTNHKAKYTPDWDHSRRLEILWWVIPTVIITILGVITYLSSHELDPSKPLSNSRPLVIQVVALQWKWLFIYPEQNIATVNYVAFPVNQAVDFQITSDAPMNSFWIPQLGGQIYAMSGMTTQEYLRADYVGSYRGYSANISGAGFANMTFEARAMNQVDFARLVPWINKNSQTLNIAAYNKLSQPNTNLSLAFYSSPESDLFSQILHKYNHMNHPTPGSDNYVAKTVGGVE